MFVIIPGDSLGDYSLVNDVVIELGGGGTLKFLLNSYLKYPLTTSKVWQICHSSCKHLLTPHMGILLYVGQAVYERCVG